MNVNMVYIAVFSRKTSPFSELDKNKIYDSVSSYVAPYFNLPFLRVPKEIFNIDLFAFGKDSN